MAPVLRTERLVLRPWRPGDRDGLWRMQSNPATMEFLMRVPDRAASDAVADRADAHFARHGFGLWVVEAPGMTDFAGYTGLVHVPYAEHFTPAVEIGWRFDPAFWGHGYATEAARAALAFGFGTLGLAEIVAITVPVNRRSRAVMERLGMVRDANGDFDHPAVPVGHPLRRQVLYRLKAGARVVSA
ncbi:GNAT family N-acetyltransferase [Xanthobacter autotrophicus]|uniref:GNAT family N-acetyltransferase n=1 Tax=Xanthobacter autotrophicus TaxID=280 RepID=UPI0024A775C4|nr:GNAT family N-acetyltransferase [Xanthobacter autotrophicus]MDI4659112.1 GNAT family N-acetyltransferase [Xanthobacter autotrophicus]